MIFRTCLGRLGQKIHYTTSPAKKRLRSLTNRLYVSYLRTTYATYRTCVGSEVVDVRLERLDALDQAVCLRTDLDSRVVFHQFTK